SFSSFSFQHRKRDSQMPRERAASATDRPFSVTSLTASTLNSRVCVRRFLAMMDLLGVVYTLIWVSTIRGEVHTSLCKKKKTPQVVTLAAFPESRLRDSNPGPALYESAALPAELSRPHRTSSPQRLAFRTCPRRFTKAVLCR